LQIENHWLLRMYVGRRCGRKAPGEIVIQQRLRHSNE
jgi:hypothetical protein